MLWTPAQDSLNSAKCFLKARISPPHPQRRAFRYEIGCCDMPIQLLAASVLLHNVPFREKTQPQRLAIQIRS
jgi:hypothetical protein